MESSYHFKTIIGKQNYEQHPTIALKKMMNMHDLPYLDRTLVSWIKRKLQNKMAVIGLSGGIDSALILALCVKAMGVKKVLPIHMPSKTTPELSTNHAYMIARQLKVDRPVLVNTGAMVDGFVESITEIDGVPTTTDKKLPIANLKARARMAILYYYSNLHNGIVVGTDNKTEGKLGYFTKYGDGGVDINPIGCLYKTQVKILAEHMGVPKEIILKPPSAELWEGQTDEVEIGMTYDEMDAILLGRELGYGLDGIIKFANVTKEKIYKISLLQTQTQHKRKLPPVPKMMQFYLKG